MMKMMKLLESEDSEDFLMQELLQLTDEITFMNTIEGHLSSSQGTADDIVVSSTSETVSDTVMPAVSSEVNAVTPTTSTTSGVTVLVSPSDEITDLISDTMEAVDSGIRTDISSNLANVTPSSLAPDGITNALDASILERIKSILLASGIELVLPVDCGRVGRHPLSFVFKRLSYKL